MSQSEIIVYLLGSGFLGSFITMLIGRFFDNRKNKTDRKLWIFRTLIANFENRCNKDFVSAINLVEIEFYKNKDVGKAWRNYRKTLDFRQDSITEKDIENTLKKITDALAELVKEIGIDLGYKKDKLDIINNSYTPSLWINDDLHIRKKEQLLMEILENKRSLNFNLVDTKDPSPHQPTS